MPEQVLNGEEDLPDSHGAVCCQYFLHGFCNLACPSWWPWRWGNLSRGTIQQPLSTSNQPGQLVAVGWVGEGTY